MSHPQPTRKILKNMEPTRVLAIRHGETAWNVATRIQGKLDIGLNNTGHSQAERLGAALAKSQTQEPITSIYSSDLRRAYDTAQAISKATDVPVVTDEGLRERGFGIFEGKTFDEVAQLWPDQAQLWRQRDPDFCPEGGESLTMFRDRILAASQALTARHPGEQIALVAHGGVMDVLYRAATGQGIQAPRTWSLANAVINRLLWSPTTFTLVGWNDTQHLEDAAMNEAHA
jgi:2,3-bisphosphoglycerate-dependent phosphoglycerate mutase